MNNLEIKDPNKITDNDFLPLEKWIVLLRSYGGLKKHPKVFFRQFLAKDYYEAYDILRSYVDKSNFEIVWFKEKRECPEYYSKTFPFLEFHCTYCNREFHNDNQLNCDIGKCQAIFCSSICIKEHIRLKHTVEKKYV